MYVCVCVCVYIYIYIYVAGTTDAPVAAPHKQNEKSKAANEPTKAPDNTPTPTPADAAGAAAAGNEAGKLVAEHLDAIFRMVYDSTFNTAIQVAYVSIRMHTPADYIIDIQNGV